MFGIQEVTFDSKKATTLLSFTLNDEAKLDNAAKSKVDKKKEKANL